MEGTALVSCLHYFVTFMFFMVLLYATITLTQSLVNMNADPADSDAQSAENTLKDAVVIGWICVGLIIVGLAAVGIMGFRGEFEHSNLREGITYLSGKDKIFTGLRVLVFSILVIVSIVMASLLKLSASFIKNDDIYVEQYNDCSKFANMMYVHVFVLFAIQGLIFAATYIYSLV